MALSSRHSAFGCKQGGGANGGTPERIRGVGSRRSAVGRQPNGRQTGETPVLRVPAGETRRMGIRGKPVPPEGAKRKRHGRQRLSGRRSAVGGRDAHHWMKRAGRPFYGNSAVPSASLRAGADPDRSVGAGCRYRTMRITRARRPRHYGNRRPRCRPRKEFGVKIGVNFTVHGLGFWVGSGEARKGPDSRPKRPRSRNRGKTRARDSG